MKNKKVLLSVLSTAVVASMASSAFAASPGFYIGGNVGHFYNSNAFFSPVNSAKIFADFETAGSENIVYVDEDGTAANLADMFDSENPLDALTDVETAFGDTVNDDYISIGEDGKDGAVIQPEPLDAPVASDLKEVVAGDKVTISGSAKNADKVTVTLLQGVKDLEAKKVDVKDGKFTVEFSGLAAGEYTYDVLASQGDVDGDYQDGHKFTIAALGLKVDSVSAINLNAVDVVFPKVTKAVENFTVVVKDPAGNVVPVKPVNLEVNDTAITFEFVTPLTAIANGNWTVDGKTFDTAAVVAVAAVADATNTVQLWNALQSPYFKNAVEANISAYKTAFDDAKADNKLVTVADVQKVIDDVNKSAVTDNEAKAIVKAVKEATNELQLLKALQNPAFVRVNPDWITTVKVDINNIPGYFTFGGLNFAPAPAYKEVADGDIKAVQAIIDVVNQQFVAIKYAGANLKLDSKKVAEVRALLNAYIVDDKVGEMPFKGLALDSLDLEDALIAVSNATTNNTLKAALVKLDTLEKALMKKYEHTGLPFDKAAELDITTVNDNLLTQYRIVIGKTGIGQKNQIKDIQKIIKDVNDGAAADLVKAVKDAAAKQQVNADELLKALNNLGLKQVAASNKEQYKQDKNQFVAANSKDAVQVAVNQSNLNAISNVNSPEALLAALNVLELKNVKAENKAAYYADANGDIDEASNVEDLQAAVDAINQQVLETAQVKAINDATDATAVQNALLALGLNNYLNIPSVDRLGVAAKVLELRAAEAGKVFASLIKVTDALTVAVTAHDTALTGVNALKSDSTISAAITVLGAVGNEDFNNLTAAQKAVVAENFLNSVEFKDDKSLKTPFKTLAAVKALMK